MNLLIGPDAHTMLAAAVSTKNIVLITDTIMCISELVTEIQTRFHVSLKPGVGTGMTFPAPRAASPTDSEFRPIIPGREPGSSLGGFPSANGSLLCPLCEKSLPDRSTLNQHLREHIGEVPSGYKCSHCKKGFSEMLELQSHMMAGGCGFSEQTSQEHSKVNEDVAGGMSDADGVGDHLDYNRSASKEVGVNPNTVADSRPKPKFKCHQCFKVFTKAYQLHLHMARHQRPLTSFNNRHRYISDPDAPVKRRKRRMGSSPPVSIPTASTNYSCSSVTSSQAVVAATAGAFVNSQPPGAPSSNSSQTSNNNNTSHISESPSMPPSSTKERPQTQVANLQKTVGSSIELPITVNNFKQVVNDAKAVPVADAQGRVMSMYSCVICSKFLQTRHSLESHYMSHLGVKPYACNYCEKRFTDNSNWRKHQRNCSERYTTATGSGFSSDLPTMVPPNYSNSSFSAINNISTLSLDGMDKNSERRPPSTSSSVSNLSVGVNSNPNNQTPVKNEPVDLTSDNEAPRNSDSNKGYANTDNDGDEALGVVVDNTLAWFNGNH